MKLGMGIISWNRPEYLKQTLGSLEKNDLTDIESHLFQDGAKCRFTGTQLTDPKKIKESIKLFQESNLPKKELHIRDENVSVAINQFEAMRFLYTNYKHFIFLENDVVVSKNFISLMKKVLKQFESDERVACISPGFRLKCYPDEAHFYMDKLMFTDGHFWAEGCWAEKWKKIEDEYLAYYDIVRQRSYRQRDDRQINNLFKRTGIPRAATSQDNGKDWAILKSGMRRARFIVNRATGIGDYGIHSTPEKMKKMGDGHNKIYVSDEELKIKEFIISSLKTMPKKPIEQKK